MKLEKIHAISGTIKILTGLHIGAGNDTIEIGGLDQPIIKDPETNAPYIPGSSIKGKMRSLLETTKYCDRPATREFVVSDGRPCACAKPDCPACAIFGVSGAKSKEELGPTRLIVRDAYLTSNYMERLKKGDLPMEVKYENSINRISGTADNPRPLERIPAGVEFEFSISFKRFEGDPKEWIDHVFEGLKLIQLDALGGHGSRGSGQVAIENLKLDGKPVDPAKYQV